MTKEKIFDEEVAAFINTSPGDSLCSAATISKKIMLRVTTDAGGDAQRGFEVEIYDELCVDFLYSGSFSHAKFSELKQKQHLMFSIDQAPRKIVTFVKEARQDTAKFLNCTLVESSDPDKCICRFELTCRNEFKDMPGMSLELKKVQGEQLNAHLIQFIEKYKRRCEEIPSLKKQIENVQVDYKRVRDELKVLKEQSEATIQELNERNDELLVEVRLKAAEAKHSNEEVETLEADLKSLQATYRNQMAEIQGLTADNEKFVEELDQCEAEIIALQEQLKDNIQQKEDYQRLFKEAETQLKSIKGGVDHYKSRLITSENRRQLLEEEALESQKLLKTKSKHLAEALREVESLKSEKEQLKIEIEGLRTHAELLTSQLSEIQAKKATLFKQRLLQPKP